MTVDGKKLVSWLKTQKYRVSQMNIVYIRDADPDTWEPLAPNIDNWNCAAVVVTADGQVLLSNQATSLPGRYWELNPLNADGCFRIAADYQQLDGWELGDHRGYPALIQCGNLFGYRDKDKDFVSEASEAVTISPDCRVDLHGCNGTDGDDTIARWSAGCLVRRYWASHVKFIQMCKDSGRKTFDATVVKGITLANYRPSC